MDNQKISAIIRVKNEEAYIGFCIQSILDTFEDVQIIIVNNNSTDNTLNIINHFKKDISLNSKDKRYCEIDIVNIDDYTPGKAINMGVKKSKNKNILIISAHCKIIKFNTKSTFEILNKEKVLFGNQIPIWNGKRIKKRYIWSNFGSVKKINYFSKDENRYFFHNAFSLFKKNILLKYPFNENLISKEDRYWANNYINLKNNIVYTPNNIVEHYYTNNGATWKNL